MGNSHQPNIFTYSLTSFRPETALFRNHFIDNKAQNDHEESRYFFSALTIDHLCDLRGLCGFTPASLFQRPRNSSMALLMPKKVASQSKMDVGSILSSQVQ